MGLEEVSVSRVTLLGATGFVGQRILRDLIQQGAQVEAVSRQPRPAGLPSNIGWTQADLNDPNLVARIPWKETVISTVLISMTAQVVELWPSGTVHHLVAFSSTSALTKANASESVDRRVSTQLQNGEAHLRQLVPQSTIIRPTMIYGGAGDRNVERVARQLKRFSLFPLIGSGLGLRQPVHVDDLATAAILASESTNTLSKTYNLGGAEILPFRDMIKKIARANNSTVRFVSIPLPVARTALLVLSPLPQFRGIPLGSLERMSQNLIFDITEATEDFDFSPRGFCPSPS